MENFFLISRIYGFDGGSIHFKKVAGREGATLTELVKLNYGFRVVEYLRRSWLGRLFRRIGVIARIEYGISLFLKVKTSSRLIVPTDSLLFLSLIAKTDRPVLYSYDIPWTYYRGNEREFVKRRLRTILADFESVLCISKGMLEIYSELGLQNVKLIDSFVSIEFRNIDVSSIAGKRPLYLGNVRFQKELRQLISACEDDIVHYGVTCDIPGMVNAGFKEDIIDYLGDSAELYFGLCVFSFDAEDYDLARSSIPSKIMTYNELRIPIIYYGPEYSEGYKLVVENKLGLAFSSLQELETFFN